MGLSSRLPLTQGCAYGGEGRSSCSARISRGWMLNLLWGKEQEVVEVLCSQCWCRMQSTVQGEGWGEVLRVSLVRLNEVSPVTLLPPPALAGFPCARRQS